MDLAFTSQKTSLFDGRHAPQMYLFYLQKKTKKNLKVFYAMLCQYGINAEFKYLIIFQNTYLEPLMDPLTFIENS